MNDKKTLGVEWSLLWGRGFALAGLLCLGFDLIIITDNPIARFLEIDYKWIDTGWFFIVLSIVFLICSLPFIVVRYYKVHVMEQVVAKGSYVEAEVIGVNRNRSIRIYGKHPYRVICEYTDEYTGKRHRFKSKNLTRNPTDFLDKTIGVYVNRANYKHYYVDVDRVLYKFNQ